MTVGGYDDTEIVCGHHDPVFVLDGQDGRASDDGLSGRKHLNDEKHGKRTKKDTQCVLHGTIGC
jgi:hypothetical protein